MRWRVAKMLSPVPSEKVSRHFRTFWRIRTSSKTFRGTLPYFSSIPPGRDTLILWSRWVRGGEPPEIGRVEEGVDQSLKAVARVPCAPSADPSGRPHNRACASRRACCCPRISGHHARRSGIPWCRPVRQALAHPVDPFHFHTKLTHFRPRRSCRPPRAPCGTARRSVS